MHNPDSGPDSSERSRRRVRLARLEADLAYFLARLEIIGDPESTNQMAQRKVFKLLHKTLAGRILQAKRQDSETL
ncbi:MAG: hypothetical protein WAM94_03655 [Chromatiaceae bacterium]|jgi:hypothetical protein